MDPWSKGDYSWCIPEAIMVMERPPEVNPLSRRVPGQLLLAIPKSKSRRRRNTLLGNWLSMAHQFCISVAHMWVRHRIPATKIWFLWRMYPCATEIYMRHRILKTWNTQKKSKNFKKTKKIKNKIKNQEINEIMLKNPILLVFPNFLTYF